jgi:hypothetical protein
MIPTVGGSANYQLTVGKYKVQAQNPDGSYMAASPGFGIHIEVSGFQQRPSKWSTVRLVTVLGLQVLCATSVLSSGWEGSNALVCDCVCHRHIDTSWFVIVCVTAILTHHRDR